MRTQRLHLSTRERMQHDYSMRQQCSAADSCMCAGHGQSVRLLVPLLPLNKLKHKASNGHAACPAATAATARCRHQSPSQACATCSCIHLCSTTAPTSSVAGGAGSGCGPSPAAGRGSRCPHILRRRTPSAVPHPPRKHVTGHSPPAATIACGHSILKMLLLSLRSRRASAQAPLDINTLAG